MRSEEDIIRVRFRAVADLELDLERMTNEDPVWRSISAKFDLSDRALLQLALFEYLTYYVARERFLAKMPSTNGPAALYMNQDMNSMEVRLYGDHSSGAERGNDGSSGVVAEGS